MNIPHPPALFMIKTKIIEKNDTAMLEVFRDKYASLAHNQVDLEYFKNSKVRIFYTDSEDNIAAGYCICSGPDYRTFLPLPPSTLEELSSKHSFKKKPPHEITCLWIEEKHRKKFWVFYFFLVLYVDLIRSPRGPLIFGTHGKSINNYFLLAFPKLIFNKRLFIPTKGEECDFLIRKGSKFHFLKGFIMFISIRTLFGNRTLYRFRLWLDARDKVNRDRLRN